ncbi:MAG: acyl-CoA dehydrogenase family protein, partial [Acidimicrobiales bacterium]
MTDTTITVEEFRRAAQAWMTANLQPRTRGLRAIPVETVEQLAGQRALQKRLFDGGFAGITYPAEYGGRGLTVRHERAFNEEGRRFVLPDLGVAGHVTMGPIGRSIAAHGSPELKARHLPRILAGEELWCQFYSEPEAGSDLAGIRTRATR